MQKGKRLTQEFLARISTRPCLPVTECQGHERFARENDPFRHQSANILRQWSFWKNDLLFAINRTRSWCSLSETLALVKPIYHAPFPWPSCMNSVHQGWNPVSARWRLTVSKHFTKKLKESWDERKHSPTIEWDHCGKDRLWRTAVWQSGLASWNVRS